jgi:hypothetical protein
MSAVKTGSITTENLAPTGTATAGSAVVAPVNPEYTDSGTAAIQARGTYTGALTVQIRLTGSDADWVTVPVTAPDGTKAVAIPSGNNSIWRADVAGAFDVRVTALAAVTGTADVVIRTARVSPPAYLGDVTLEGGDIQLGAVEIKDATSDNRQIVGADGRALVRSGGFTSTVEVTRPDNATAYTAGDMIGVADSGTPANAGSAILEFANIGPAAGAAILLVDWSLMISLNAIPSGMTGFRMALYNAAPDAKLDNDAWDLSSSGDRSKYLGFIDMGAPADLGSTLFAQVQNVPKQVQLVGTSLFGVLRTLGAYTPASQTVYTPKINATPL